MLSCTENTFYISVINENNRPFDIPGRHKHTWINQEISSKLPCGGQVEAFVSQISVHTESSVQAFISRHWPISGMETAFLRTVAEAGTGSAELDRHGRPREAESLVQCVKTVSNCIARVLSAFGIIYSVRALIALEQTNTHKIMSKYPSFQESS